MEMWELFVKGLAKTFEEFTRNMIEKGKEVEQEEAAEKPSGAAAERRQTATKTTARKRTIPHRDLGALETQILDIVGEYPDGVTLKDVAARLDMQWHYLRIPFRQLTMEGKLNKEDKLYTLTEKVKARHTKKENHGPAPKAPPPERHTSETKPSEGTKQKTATPRRRVVNASELEKKESSDAALSHLSIRDRERLRYRILTALRGRPEGLNLEKLSAVLGMELALLKPILTELQKESKVVQVDNDKFRLP